MSKNSQKTSYSTFLTWLRGVNPKSESLHQPKVLVAVERKQFKKF